MLRRGSPRGPLHGVLLLGAEAAGGGAEAEAAARTDEQWRENAIAWSGDDPAATGRQFVATTSDGVWVASLVCVVQRAGEPEFGGGTIPSDRGQLLGVYVDPAYRGRGLLGRFTQAAEQWARERGLGALSLWVHEDNARARAAYARLGFRPTGVTADELDPARPRLLVDDDRAWPAAHQR